MDSLFPFLSPAQLGFALLIAVGSGFVNGVVGFAMPLVLISGLTLFIAPEYALAGLILPTLVSNGLQALRQGVGQAWASIKDFRAFLIVGGITLVAAAQLVRIVPSDVLMMMIGVPVVAFVLLQLSGYRFQIARRSVTWDMGVGAVTGLFGGVSGVWSATTVSYLTALDTDKLDQIRIQGVIYGLGAIALLGAHLGSGVLRAETWPFSVLLILPAVLGMWIGGKVADRIDQLMFRRATLIVLLLAGGNLVRRSLF
jgi:uncharacterized membrane protein YfcA